MEPFPAEWRTVGGSEPTGAAATPDRGAEKHGRGPWAVERSHRLIAFVAAAAVAAGLVALAGMLWLTPPHGEVDVAAHAATSTGDGAGLQGLVVRGSPTAAFTSSAPIDRPAEIVVDVEGAVRRPGIHRLAAGSRVGDAIAAGEHVEVVDRTPTPN